MRAHHLGVIAILALIGASARSAAGPATQPAGLLVAPPLAKLNTPFAPAAGMLEYVNGLDKLAAFDLPAAIAAFNDASAKMPGHESLILSLAMARAMGDDRDQIEQAVKELEPLRRAGQRDREADREVRRLLAFALSRTGREVRLTDIYSFSKQDRFDRLIQSAFGAPDANDPWGQAGFAQRKQRRLREVATVFALRQKQGLEPAKVLFFRGLDRKKAKDFAGACEDLSIVVAQYPTDWSVAFQYSAALTSAGDFEKSRRIVSLALRNQPALVEGYCQRAMAAGRMGGIDRARADLAIARQLDPQDTRGAIASAQKIVDEDSAKMPAESPRDLLAALLAKAREGQSIDQLSLLAQRLVRAGNAHRLWGDEIYQEKLRQLQWAALVNPKDADVLGRLGRFLVDEHEVRGEWIDPDHTWTHYRLQTDELQEAELKQAREAFQKALGINSRHVPSLLGMALIEYRACMFANAENYARVAMDVRPDDPEVLDMMSRLMAIAAGQYVARATSLIYSSRTVISEGHDHVWIREITPTAEAYAMAGKMFSGADALLAQAKAYTQAALKSLKNNPESYDYLGTYGFREKKYDIAARAYEKAVQMKPDKIEYQYGLANAYSELNDFDKYLGPCTIGRNLEQTSIAAHLLGAWQRIGGGNLDGAAVLLEDARKIDPADSRIAAFLGAIAEGRGDRDGAAATLRAAIAIEDARMKSRDYYWPGGSRRIAIDEIELLIGLRSRLARVIEENDPKSAAQLYQQNLAFEQRLRPADMIQLVPDVLLPVANQPHKKADSKRRCPRAGEVFEFNCGRAAMLLYRSGQTKEAAELFRRVRTYGEYRALAGASRYEDFDTPGWTSGVDPATAAECLTKAGDADGARQWNTRPRRMLPGYTPAEN